MAETRTYGGYVYERAADGSWTRKGPAQPQMPADPTYPYQGAQAQAQAANTGAEAQVNQATIPAQITAANADATAKTREARTAGLPEGFQWREDGSGSEPIPGFTRQGLSPEVRQTAINGYNNAASLERIADELEQQYNAGPGATKGIWGLRDYLPTGQNQRFDATANQARGYVKQGLGFTGGEGNTVGEIALNYGPYLPEAGDRDEVIVGKIEALRNLARDSRAKATAVLGGVPDANGNITPQRQEEQPLPNALTMNRLIGGGPSTGGAAPGGSTTGTAGIPPAMQAEYEARLPGVTSNGRFDPDAYAAMRGELDRKYGFPDTSADTYRAWATESNAKLDRGGHTVSTTIPAPPKTLSLNERQSNDLVSNPVGALAAGFMDSAGFGGVSALAPDQMAALGDQHNIMMPLGQIGGSITGSAALGKLGAETIGRVAPRLVGGERVAQFGRNLATDVGYSGIYGGVSEGDPLSGAVEGGVGSLLGQGGGKLLGATLGGVARSAPVQALADLNIPMTIPQQLGGFAKGVEDKAISWPLVGDMIRARRAEGLDAFNRRAFNEAGSPIGATVQDIGQEGIQALTDQIGDAYTNATAGAPSIPLDDRFIADMQGVIARGEALPSDHRLTLGSILERRLAPATDTGELSGEGFQQAMRGLKSSRAAADRLTPGFESDYRDTITGAMNALEGQMMRGGGEDVVTGLNAANAANRNMRTIEDAATRAAGGSETGTPFVFTPSQLQRAGLKTAKTYPGPRPFASLADNGQAVLPSRIPNSGTADRLMQGGIGAGILGGGTGLGYLAGGDMEGAQKGAATSAALTAALLLGGTRGGQKGLGKFLFDRPATAEMLGRAISRRSGLFGSGTIPLVMLASD